MLADLEKGKLIARRSNGEDRRENLLEITEAGAKLLIEDIRGQRARLSQAIEGELTGAEKELLRIAADLMDRIAEKTKDSDVRREAKSKRKKT
jgi:DNA-binding MarR family transcriptional regulator